MSPSRIYGYPESMDEEKVRSILQRSIQNHDVAQVRETESDGVLETWHHGNTKVKGKDIVILGVVDPDEKQAQITVFCDLEEMTTGLLAEIGREFREEMERSGPKIVNISIRDSVVYRSTIG